MMWRSVVLNCRKAIPILANRTLKVLLSGNLFGKIGANMNPAIAVFRTGLNLSGSA